MIAKISKKKWFGNLVLIGSAFLGTCLHAMPDYAAESEGRCIACHGTPLLEQSSSLSWGGLFGGEIVEGKMQIPMQSQQLDLGTQLDGQILGLLEVFDVSPGDTIELPVEVLDGVDYHAVALVGMEDGGQLSNEGNQLNYEYSGDDYWTIGTAFGDVEIDYIYSEIARKAEPDVHYLPLQILEDTPNDVYLLTFEMARRSGVQLQFQEQSFYLRVGSGEAAIVSAPDLKILKLDTGLVLEFKVSDDFSGNEILVEQSSDFSSWATIAKRSDGLHNLNTESVVSIVENEGIVRLSLSEAASNSSVYRLGVL